MIDSLKADVVRLATPRGRMVGTAGHDEARAYLVERLTSLGLAPYGPELELPYSVGSADLCNIVALAPGRDPELPPVVLAAHYDTCGPLPGADDNAAAIAIALRVASRLTADPAARSVVLALFDGEEPPHFLGPAMGSRHWYHHQRTAPVHAAIVLDLVGHDVAVPGLEDLVFMTGMESDPGLVGLADAVPPGLRLHPVLNRYVGDLSDHGVFREEGRPFLFVTCARWEHYHMASDTPDKLNYRKMERIADLVEGLVRRASAAELGGPFMGGDTLELEVAAIERHFGSMAGGAVRLFGRRGVDAFVELAKARFGI